MVALVVQPEGAPLQPGWPGLQRDLWPCHWGLLGLCVQRISPLLYSQRVQGAKALEGIRRDFSYLVVAQVSVRGIGERVAEFLSPTEPAWSPPCPSCRAG
jgi:hypothetical protein